MRNKAIRKAYPQVVSIADDKFAWDAEGTEVVLDEDCIAEALAVIMKVAAATEYQRLRAVAYPDYREFLDGIVKDDRVQIDAYREKCLEVKARFPKPAKE